MKRKYFVAVSLYFSENFFRVPKLLETLVLTHFSPVFHCMQKSVIWLVVETGDSAVPLAASSKGIDFKYVVIYVKGYLCYKTIFCHK